MNQVSKVEHGVQPWLKAEAAALQKKNTTRLDARFSHSQPKNSSSHATDDPLMSKSNQNNSTAIPAPVFPKAMHELRVTPAAVLPHAKDKKRDNLFSKSRDTREDRGQRKMKTAQNPQTNHGKK